MRQQYARPLSPTLSPLRGAREMTYARPLSPTLSPLRGAREIYAAIGYRMDARLDLRRAIVIIPNSRPTTIVPPVGCAGTVSQEQPPLSSPGVVPPPPPVPVPGPTSPAVPVTGVVPPVPVAPVPAVPVALDPA